MPVDPKIAEAVLTIRRSSAYSNPNDFIFAGSSGKPRWNGIMLTDHIKPADARAGLGRYFHFYNYERLHQSLGYRTLAADVAEVREEGLKPRPPSPTPPSPA